MTAIGGISVSILAGLTVLILTFLVIRYRTLLGKAEHALGDFSKRQMQAYEMAKHCQKDLRSCVRFMPAKVLIAGRHDRKFIQPSEALINWIETWSGKPETPDTLTSYLFSSDKYPGFFPVLKRRLKDGSIASGVFHDILKVPFDNSACKTEHSVNIRIDVLEGVVCVWFDSTADKQNQQSRERSDASVIRSILNETDLPTALESSSALLRCQLGNGVACSVSLLDGSAKTLKLVWSKGLDSTIRGSVARLPLVFGDSPSATALLTETSVRKAYNSPGVRREVRIMPESIVSWHSYPILSNDGDALGTVDFYLSDGVSAQLSDDAVGNFLFVVAVLLERKVAMSTIFRQARLDQAVKEVGQRLMVATDGASSSTLNECLIFLTTATPLSDGKIGIVYDFGSDEAETVGRLFEHSGDPETDQSAPRLSAVKAICADVIALQNGGMALETVLVESGSSTAAQLISELPICDDSASASFFVCPLLLGRGQMGAIIFALPGDQIPDAAYGNIMDMVSPSIASYLSRENLLRELEKRANHDQLTGLLNRGCIEERLSSEIKRSNRYENELSVILFDIDHFKQINDQFGHDVGDEVLKQVARRAEASIRAVDLIGRWGGEEFLVILVETDLASAKHVAENIRRLIESDVYETNKPVTISAGVACYLRGDSSGSLVKRADIALYKAKEQGRNQVVTTT